MVFATTFHPIPFPAPADPNASFPQKCTHPGKLVSTLPRSASLGLMLANSLFTRSTRLLYSSNNNLVDFLAVLERTKSPISAPPTVTPPAPATTPPNVEIIKVNKEEVTIIKANNLMVQ